MIRHVAMHELRLMLRSPFAWVAAGLLQLLFGWLFLSALDRYITLQSQSNTSLSNHLIINFLAPISIVFLIATPLLCMHFIAGEKQSMRYNLLLSLPLSAAQFVLGKFSAAVAFQAILLSLSAVLVLLLSLSVDLAVAHLIAATLGLLLFISAITAITLFYSSITHRPILAAFASVITLALLWIAAATSSGGILQFISPSAHLHSFMQGALDTRDAIFLTSVTAIFLTLCTWRFDARRTRGATNA